MSSNNIKINNSVFYYYIRRDNSADSCILSFKKIKSTLATRHIIARDLNLSYLNKYAEDGYNHSFYHNFLEILALLFRTKEKETKKIIIKSLICLYNKCKNKLYIDSNFPYKWILEYLKQNKNKELINKLSNYKKEKYLIYPPKNIFTKIFNITRTKKQKILITFLGLRITV